MQAQVTREWVTYRQAEEIAGLSRTTLRKLADQGSIKVRHIGRAVRINRESLDAFMNSEVRAADETDETVRQVPARWQKGRRAGTPYSEVYPKVWTGEPAKSF